MDIASFIFTHFSYCMFPLLVLCTWFFTQLNFPQSKWRITDSDEAEWPRLAWISLPASWFPEDSHQVFGQTSAAGTQRSSLGWTKTQRFNRGEREKQWEFKCLWRWNFQDVSEHYMLWHWLGPPPVEAGRRDDGGCAFGPGRAEAALVTFEL